MADMVLQRLKQVLDAYGARDADRAMDVWRRDGEIDAMYTSLFRELLTYMMEDPRISRSASICCSAPRISSASAITRPISPRRSTISSSASR
jgi:phosphate uptake regulator